MPDWQDVLAHIRRVEIPAADLAAGSGSGRAGTSQELRALMVRAPSFSSDGSEQ